MQRKITGLDWGLWQTSPAKGPSLGCGKDTALSGSGQVGVPCPRQTLQQQGLACSLPLPAGNSVGRSSREIWGRQATLQYRPRLPSLVICPPWMSHGHRWARTRSEERAPHGWLFLVAPPPGHPSEAGSEPCHPVGVAWGGPTAETWERLRLPLQRPPWSLPHGQKQGGPLPGRAGFTCSAHPSLSP